MSFEQLQKELETLFEDLKIADFIQVPETDILKYETEKEIIRVWECDGQVYIQSSIDEITQAFYDPNDAREYLDEYLS